MSGTEVYFNRPGRPIPLDRLLADMRGAQDRLSLASAWFTLDVVADAFIAAPAKTKEVILNAADLERDHGIGRRVIRQITRAEAATSRRTHWSNFMVAILGGADFREGIMHHKAVVIDRRIVWTGSYNFTYQAPKNYEALLRIEDPEVAGAFADELEALAWAEGVLWDAERLGESTNLIDGDAFRCLVCGRIWAIEQVADPLAAHGEQLVCQQCFQE